AEATPADPVISKAAESEASLRMVVSLKRDDERSPVATWVVFFGDLGEPGSQRCRQDWDLIG
ncbi:hypothetical protein ACV36C_37815, partial [Pseudomonas aeruginosa]